MRWPWAKKEEPVVTITDPGFVYWFRDEVDMDLHVDEHVKGAYAVVPDDIYAAWYKHNGTRWITCAEPKEFRT